MTPAADLLARLEGATEDQGYLIKCVLREARAQHWIDSDTFDRAMHWAACGAFVDAALTLVPEGMEFEITTLYGPARVAMGLNVNHAGPWYSERLDGNIALALVTAAIRARAEQE